MTDLAIQVLSANQDLSLELQEAATGRRLLEQATGFVGHCSAETRVTGSGNGVGPGSEPRCARNFWSLSERAHVNTLCKLRSANAGRNEERIKDSKL